MWGMNLKAPNQELCGALTEPARQPSPLGFLTLFFSDAEINRHRLRLPAWRTEQREDHRKQWDYLSSPST